VTAGSPWTERDEQYLASLYKMHRDGLFSIDEIASKLDRSTSAVQARVRSLNLAGTLPGFDPPDQKTVKKGVKTTDIGPAPQRRGRRRPNTRQGKRDYLGGLYVRSSWEANVAQWLNLRIENGEIDRWEYEIDLFEFPVKRGSKFYTPDFKVWVTEKRYHYIEVKGYMDQPSRTKLRRMALHFPQEEVRVVGRTEYREIEREFRHLLPNWED
jgi:hypothetical protein